MIQDNLAVTSRVLLTRFDFIILTGLWWESDLSKWVRSTRLGGDNLRGVPLPFGVLSATDHTGKVLTRSVYTVSV